jgi:hypothetical protein
MSKDFMNNSPLGKMVTPTAAHTNTQKKKAPGRPVEKDVKNKCKKINIAVPIKDIEKLNEVKFAIGGNQTAYIVGLIEKDLNENYARYKQIADLQNSVGIKSE